MADLSALRPADTSPASIAQALDRCHLAARGAAAELGRLKAVRAALLMSGHPAQIDANAAELARAAVDAQAVLDLTAQLTALLATADPAQSAEAEARAKAFEAAGHLARWWTTNGAILLNGLQLMAHGLAAISEWQTAAAHAAAPSSTNIVPLAPRPPGAV